MLCVLLPERLDYWLWLLSRLWKCGPNRDEIIGCGRNVLNEELHKFYSSPSKIRMIKSRSAGLIAVIEEKKNVCRLVVKPKGKRPLGKRRHKWEVNIKLYLR
jgi:hypothetical protein